MKKYVITGGPCVGKTTVLELLATKGHAILPEAARMIIEEETLRGSDVLPWKNLVKFQEAVVEQQLKNEADAKADAIFLDRSLVDGFAYCTLGGIPAPERLSKNAVGRYEKVFLLEPLSVYAKDGARTEDERTAKLIHDEIAKAYAGFGYEPIVVPALSPEERIIFILERL